MKKTIITLSVMALFILIMAQIPLVQNIAFGLYFNLSEQTELSVKGKTLYMDGLINAKTPQQFKDIFQQYPEIDTLVMIEVEGSVDDEANLEAAEWVSKKKLVFVLEPESLIASGGTDFFLAGKTRIINEGAQVGVHSWAGNNEVATDFPRGHEYHQPYIEYYTAVGWSRKDAEKFYYYTIEAAPADNIHWMTEQELIEYQIVTQEL